MIIFGVNVIVVFLFILQKWLNRTAPAPGGRAEKPYRAFRWFFLVAPVMAASVFSVLFSTVLTGRFHERCSHALVLCMLWLFATSFYADLVFFIKSRRNRLLCIAGMVTAAGTVVPLTPLDNYVVLLGTLVPTGTYILGIGMLLAYTIGWLYPRSGGR